VKYDQWRDIFVSVEQLCFKLSVLKGNLPWPQMYFGISYNTTAYVKASV
jgi:hypothetical protein